MALNPDVIFISPFKRGGYDAIRNVDIPMIPHLGYKELSPLGQAEWIKVIGLLTGNAEKAKAMCHALFDAGLMSFIAGGKISRIRFLLPLGVVTTQHIDRAAEIIEEVVQAMSS